MSTARLPASSDARRATDGPSGIAERAAFSVMLVLAITHVRPTEYEYRELRSAGLCFDEDTRPIETSLTADYLLRTVTQTTFRCA
jgi:hypothetical protein